MIATRIKNVFPNIIHHNQTGYVKDRYIGETIRSVFDLMDFTGKESIAGLMIFIDFEKAVDSVKWEFLLYCLHPSILAVILSIGSKRSTKKYKAVW